MAYHKEMRTKYLATTAVFAVIYMILRYIPTFPLVGLQGGFFSASDVIAPLYGIILGPYIGGASVILGTYLSIAFGRPMIFLGLDFLPATVNAIALGFLIRKRWLPVIILYASLIVIFLIHPFTLVYVRIPFFGQEVNIPFNWMHLTAFIVLVSPLSRKAVNWVTTKSLTRLAPGIALLIFIGTMMQHTTGSILFETILGYVILFKGISVYWTAIFYIYPFERIFLTIIATVIGAPLIRTLTISQHEQLRQFSKPRAEP